MKQGLLVLIAVSGCFTFRAAEVSAAFVHIKQPLISNVHVSGLTNTSAAISWLSSLSSDSQLEYGTTTAYGSLTTLDPTLTRSHTVHLSGLAPNTLYHFSVMSRTSAGTLYSAGDFTFATPPTIIADMIASLNISGITRSSAVISWTTSTPTNAIVEFGATYKYGQFSRLDTRFATSHSVVLSDLVTQSPYHFRAISVDGNGNFGMTADATFVTSEIDSPAIFGGIHASEISSSSATIRWVTTSPASTQVDYGTGPGYGSSTAMDPALVGSHSQTLTGLKPDTLYHYRVRSTDGAGNPAVSADFTFSTLPITLFYPQLAADPDTYTSIAVSSIDPGTAQLSFTAFGPTGTEILASDLANPVDKSLGAGAQMAVIQNQLFGSGVSTMWPLGWTMVNSSTPRLAGFFLTFNSSLSSVDGADVSSRSLTSFVLPETGNQDFTTVLLANPNAAEASITIDLVKTDGTVRSSVQTSIPGWGVYSADLTTATFAGIDTDPSDYVRVGSSQGLLAYEYYGNVAKDEALLAGQDLNSGGETLYSPQYVIGGPYNSILSIVNLDSTPGDVSLELIGDDGSPIGATKVLPIAGSGKIYLRAADFFLGSTPSGLTQGYVRLTSNGVRLSGSVTFSDAVNGTFSAALPLVADLKQSEILSHIASNNTFFTGLAILNPGGQDATVTIDLYTDAGQRDQSVTQIVPAGRRVSQLLTQYFPALVGRDRSSGYIRVTSDQAVACFGVFGTTTLSALSAIPAQPVQ